MAFIGTLRGVTLSRRGKQWGRLKEGRSEAFFILLHYSWNGTATYDQPFHIKYVEQILLVSLYESRLTANSALVSSKYKKGDEYNDYDYA